MTHQVPLNSLNTSVCSQKSILSHSSQAIKPASKLFATDPVIEMPRVLEPFRFVLIAVAGWMNQRQLQIIDYLSEENRVLREQLSLHNVPVPAIYCVDEAALECAV